MNVREILDKLEECNEEATVSCILQSTDGESMRDTKVIRTESDEGLVDIVVMDINQEGIIVTELIDELRNYGEDLRVAIKENRIIPVRFPYEIIGVDCQGNFVNLKLPQLMARLFKE